MHGAGDVRIENVPDPTINEPTDAVVRVTRACICGSDLWPYKTLPHSETGRVMGHEAIGIVEATGADVRTLTAGDLVVMPFAFSDGTCLFCDDGLPTSCVHGGFFGTPEVPGAQAEAVRMPLADGDGEAVTRVPANPGWSRSSTRVVPSAVSEARRAGSAAGRASRPGVARHSR
jgi:threonine dehydrogenase-like Zn-dependent dehydrogenase